MLNWKPVLKILALFLAGLLIGGFFFFPKQSVWSTVLDKAAADTPGWQVSWDSIEDAGFLGFTLTGLLITSDSGKTTFNVPRARVEAGIFNLVDLTLDTGPSLNIVVSRSKDIRVDGSLDLETFLRRPDVQGVVGMRGQVSLEDWNTPPKEGEIDLTVPRLSVPGGLTIENGVAQARLEGDLLTISSFAVEKPLPAQGTGTASLSWSDFRQTTYRIEGSSRLGDKEQAFKQSGRLGQLGF